jgi:Uma2 family endonuclease
MRTPVTPADALSVYGPPQGRWTAQNWETLPDDGSRYEIIDGELYRSTSPSRFHHWILKQFVIRWGARVEDSSLGCVHFAPVGVLMPGSEPVQPDLVFIPAGVPEYAVIDPDQRRLKRFRLDAQRRYGDALVFSLDQTVAFQAAPSVPLCIAKLFAGSPDTMP